MNPQPNSRRLIIIIWLAVGAMALPAAAWPWGETARGNGVVRQQTRETGHFKGVALSLPAQVEIRMGDVESVSVETDENLLPLVATVVEKGTLHIRPAKGNLKLKPRSLKVVVQARQIDQLAVGGAGSIKVAALKTPTLDLGVGGSGAIDVSGVESDSIETAVGGSGSVTIAGAARKLSVSIGGSGDVKAGGLKTDDASVSIGGSGDVTVWAARSLSAAIAGAGDVKYYGDPKVQTTVVGSGGAKRLGPAPR
jgi:hypothetical protein